MKYKILKMLEDSSDFLSGEKIGEKLNVTRAAVCKNIAKLKDMGYHIESVNNRGYKLELGQDLLNEFELKKRLNTKYLGQNCKFYNEIASTNDEAKNVANDVDEGYLIFSDKQTKGKGRLGRNWCSDEGVGVYFSFVLKPDIMPYDAPKLTLVTGVAVRRAIQKLTGLDTKIKWPNDIIVNGKKVAGILTEMSAEIEKVKYIVIGIGINVNNQNFNQDISFKATSLKKELGKSVNRSELLALCLKEIENCYQVFKVSGFSALNEEYNKNCINIGLDVKAVLKNKEISGKAIEVNNDGEIIIQQINGERINIFGGEVSLRRSDGKYI